VLTRIRTDQIADKQVTKVDLADGAVDGIKLDTPTPGNSGDALLTDGFWNIYFGPISGALTLNDLQDVDLTGALPGNILQFNGTDWTPTSLGVAGGGNRTWFVNTEAELVPLLGTAENGDMGFVRIATDGEWRLFLLVDGAWQKISTKDSSGSDSRTIEALVEFDDSAGPVLLGNVSQGSRATLVTVEVTIPFNGAPSLTVGDIGDNERLIGNDFHDLSETGTYNVQTDYVFSQALDTDIFVYFSSGGSTSGSARVLVTYV
jgi:hypothetical protein